MNGNPAAALRNIDANINRTQEALRVIEDTVRFCLSDKFLTENCKSLRHEFTNWTRHFDSCQLVSVRNASGDVGRSSDVEDEYRRTGPTDLLLANFGRAKQSMRSLEEYSKTIQVQYALEVEHLRYRVYDLEKSVLSTFDSLNRLDGVWQCALIDCRETEELFVRTVEQLIRSHIQMIQLRDKHIDTRTLVARARLLVKLTREAKYLSIINDRPDVAVAADADGVHLGQDDLDVFSTRRIVGPKKLIGVSTHGIEQGRQAVLDGANYIGVGPVFPSRTKTFDRFPGIELVRQVAAEISLPAFAIGGIHSGNIPELFEAGCRRVAFSGCIPIEPAGIPAAMRELTGKFAEAQAVSR